MIPAKESMILRKLGALEEKLERAESQLRVHKAVADDLHDTVDMQARRIAALGQENGRLSKQLERHDRTIGERIRRGKW